MKSRLNLFLLLLLSRIPFLIYYYPGCVPGDTFTSIAQWHGVRDFTADLAGAGTDVIFTNHLPFLTTILYGTFYDFGALLGNPDSGLFLFALLQTLLLCDVVSRIVWWFQKGGVLTERTKQYAFLAAYMFFPFFGLWSMDLVKDSLMALAMLWLTYSMLKREYIEGSGWRFGVVLLLFMLTKNQCPYIVIALALLLLCFNHKYAKTIGLRFSVPLLLYYGVWMGIVLPAAHVAPVGRQELMGSLFQQSARYCQQYPQEVTKEEQASVRAVLSSCEDYNPRLQDPVKFSYNPHATSTDLKRYLTAWAHMGMKHPATYIAATWQNCNAYFVPGLTNEGEVYPLASTGENVGDKRTNLAFLQRIPLVGRVLSIGTFVWLLLGAAAYSLWRKKREALIIMAPALIQSLVLVLSPENGCYRYVLPIIWCIPIYIALAFGSTATRSAMPQ